MTIACRYLGNGRCEFIVWAPVLNSVDLKIVSPEKLSFPIIKDEKGYRRILTEGVFPGALYFYCLDGQRDRPDPASHSQPQGVHGPSEVLDHSTFKWEDSGWKGIPLSRMVMYEIHVGTFTPEGTFDAVILRLDELRELGVTAIELMPVAQFPGSRHRGDA